MQGFSGKVAVITGAASGIGFGIAKRAAREGMKVVLADVEEEALGMAEEKIKAAEAAATISVRTDVSRYEDYESLAGQAYDTFGAVHLLCNNAGVAVAVTRPIWACTIDDWRWITGVNYWGVVHGIRAFVPRMLEGGQEGHIVNTSSSAGLLSGPALGPYKAAKHAVLSMTETLANDLITAGSKLRASALCPSFVATGLRNSGRNRPGALSDGVQRTAAEQEAEDRMSVASRERGIHPDQVGDILFDAIKEDKLYVFTDDNPKETASKRLEEILAGGQPAPSALSL